MKSNPLLVPQAFHRATRCCLLTLCLLPWLATSAQNALHVRDARPQPAQAASWSRADGAHITFKEDRLSPTLIERLAGRLERQGEHNGTLEITRAHAELFIAGAYASPGTVSTDPAIRKAARERWPDEVSVVEHTSATGERQYRVFLEGNWNGQAFKVNQVASFRGKEPIRLLEKTADAAVAKAIDQIKGEQPLSDSQ